MVTTNSTFCKHHGKLSVILSHASGVYTIRHVGSDLRFYVRGEDLQDIPEAPSSDVRDHAEQVLREADDREEYHNWLETVE